MASFSASPIRVLAVLFACAAASRALAAPPDTAVAERIVRHGEAPVIVALQGVQPPAAGSAGRAALRALQRRQDEVLAALPGGTFRLRHRYAQLPGLAGTVDAAGYARLAADPRVAAVYLDGELHATLVEGRALVRADTLHAAGIDGAGVTVAIVDTGIDYRNLNLGGCFGPACKVRAGYDFVNLDPDPLDDHSHGTAVAGIVAADGAHPDPPASTPA